MYDTQSPRLKRSSIQGGPLPILSSSYSIVCVQEKKSKSILFYVLIYLPISRARDIVYIYFIKLCSSFLSHASSCHKALSIVLRQMCVCVCIV